MLREEFLLPMGLSAHAFVCGAACAGRVNDIVRGRRGVAADTAMRLARYFSTNAEWYRVLNLNPRWLLALAERVNDFAAPFVMNLLCKSLAYSGRQSPMAVG